MTGYVYLLHFDQPYKHARHYLGYTVNVDQRLAMHAAAMPDLCGEGENRG